jgi:NAD(P)-dependent dehydrogenase (short-subunit alcohol dehydrogenase family)
MMIMDQGRVIVLTGAGGGIGKAITAALLDDGHDVVAVDRDEERLAALGSELGSSNGQLLCIDANLEQPAAASLVVEKALQQFGRVEAVINNAGVGQGSIREDAEENPPGIEELKLEDWERFFLINTRAAFLMVKAALPQMRAAGWGRIVSNTTSYKSMQRVLPYGATKAALESMTTVWAQEMDGDSRGVTANVVHPGGPTDTPLINQQSSLRGADLIRPEVMAAPIAWLMSGDSNGYNGLRVTAAHWQPGEPLTANLERASRPLLWEELRSCPTEFAWGQTSATS